jgi:hypothetical protein
MAKRKSTFCLTIPQKKSRVNLTKKKFGSDDGQDEMVEGLKGMLREVGLRRKTENR